MMSLYVRDNGDELTKSTETGEEKGETEGGEDGVNEVEMGRHEGQEVDALMRKCFLGFIGYFDSIQ